MTLLLREMATYFNALILQVQLFFWFRTHTLAELEQDLISLGCTKVYAHGMRIYTTANGAGKIVVTDNELWINPK